MEFCICGNYLLKKEIIENTEKKLILYCSCCNYQTYTTNYQIFSKNYKNQNNIISNNNIEYNKIKINDKTLPNIIMKCKKCKKISNNKYELCYINNSYHRNIICSKCYNNFFKIEKLKKK
jgi:hypothetical protein